MPASWQPAQDAVAFRYCRDMPPLPTICVIGAGASGIAAAKALHERGFAFDCFEASDRVGGMWVYGGAGGRSAAYRTLHTNTSRKRTEFSDFPMPESCPDFPHHSHLAAYFDAYVDCFGFRDRITFETAVTRAERIAGGGWTIETDRGETRRYDALIVANGHHWDPRPPEPAFPGSDRFAGRQMHSHEYTGDDPGLFRDRCVVVLGMGNSAMDIAVEASLSGRRTYLAARRGAWVIPKYIFGRPMDSLPPSPRIPFEVRRRGQEALLRLVVGDMRRYGLPKPDHGFGEAHPTVSSDVLSRLVHGEITPKPNIARLTQRTVVFADGSEVEADVVVYCTGYKVSFPFFDPGLIAAPDNDLPLYRRVFHPGIGDVFFVGLLQPFGAIMPLAELQSEWICDHLAGRYHLPPPAERRAEIEAERAARRKRFVASTRHTMEVDFEDYILDARRERRRGGRRARLAGGRLPVPPRAAAGAPA
jgi:dimethylaniline monooxygenase (N-oxide forming)